MNLKSGKHIERKICETEIETCEASDSCPRNTDDSDGTVTSTIASTTTSTPPTRGGSDGSNTNDGGAEVDDGKCWKEYLGKEVRWVHSPPFNNVPAFTVNQDARDYCEETV